MLLITEKKKMVVYLDESTLKLARDMKGNYVMYCIGYCQNDFEMCEGTSKMFSFCVS